MKAVTRTGTKLDLIEKMRVEDRMDRIFQRKVSSPLFGGADRVASSAESEEGVELDHVDGEHDASSTEGKVPSLTAAREGGDIVAYGCFGYLPSLLTETVLFSVLLLSFEAFLLVVYGVWIDYLDDSDEAREDIEIYPYFADINIMIYFGFGFLMTFLRRYGYSAVGYTLLFSSIAVQWSIPLGFLFRHDWDDIVVAERQGVSIEHLLEGLFTAATVMISFGAVLGKVTPTQLLLMTVVEPIFYWINYFFGAVWMEALDVGGGMWIHTFGAYYGLAVALVLTTSKSRANPDNTSNYHSDVFSLAGTVFLWIMWPSFNGVLAPDNLSRIRAIVNTFLSLTGATASTFLVSRWVGKGRLDVVHVQNATLAGGVAMGVVADLYLYPAVALACGAIAGAISVLGYRFLTPLLSRYLHIQDVCGVHNLHGMPGVFGSIVAIFATFGVSLYDDDDTPRGYYQPLIQLAALVVTLIISIGSGLATGILMRLVGCITPMLAVDFFNDYAFWDSPSDYTRVARDAEELGWLNHALHQERSLWDPEVATQREAIAQAEFNPNVCDQTTTSSAGEGDDSSETTSSE